MKAIIMMCSLFSVGILNAAAQKVKPAIPFDSKIEAQVETTLSKMSLDEKIGQMCEITVDVITDVPGSANGFKISEEKLNEVIGKYKVGSILNVPLSIAQTPDVWAKSIYQINKKSMETMKIPDIYGVDQMHGTTYTMGGTLFPQEINQASSFNRTIPFRVSEICAYESKAGMIPWVYAPVMDLGRQPSWSRMWESYGEDCYLNSEMAQQAVRGFQGNNPNNIGAYNVAACLKHYMAYGVPTSGKDRTPSSVTDREMREKFFKPFLNAIKAGALSLMVNSGINDGVPFHANKKFLTDWVKEGLNWDGMIVTDWADINNLCVRDHIAATKKEAIAMAINAGIDMSMVPYELTFCDDLKALVQEGTVPMSRIDDAVRRILRLKYRCNLFNTKTWDNPKKIAKNYPDFGSEKFATEALKFAEESEVLLKNTDNILPLAKGKKILLTGPNANTMRGLLGGWSYSWQGDKAEECAVKYNTIYEAISNKYGKESVSLVEGVTYKKGGNWEDEDASQINEAVKAAGNCDVIIACIGENSYAETPGNLTNLTLSDNQRSLVKALAQTGKPIILILNEGRPRIIEDIEPLSKAIVDVMLPGNYGGDALANLLAGDANFSAKLPFTYPHKINAIATYDYKPCENMGQMDGNYNYDSVMDVQWLFGHGLSYTTFKYNNLKVDKANFNANDMISFSIDVTNTGKVTGKEPVLLFIGDVVASITPDNTRLRGFEKIELQPGETKTVSILIKGSDLAFVGADNKWVLEKGEFRVKCGDQHLTINCTDTHRWESQNID